MGKKYIVVTSWKCGFNGLMEAVLSMEPSINYDEPKSTKDKFHDKNFLRGKQYKK